MKQEVWDIDIYANLTKILREAKKEILVATAWFTDEELYRTLCTKLEEGLKVGVIISDNEDNKYLDFKKFKSLGGKLIRVPQDGRGMMHDKYCIVDNKTVVSGSYNWTKNARNNNKESVICTDDKKIVHDFRNKFIQVLNIYNKGDNFPNDGKKGLFNFIKKAFKVGNKRERLNISNDVAKTEKSNLPENKTETSDFDAELNSIIASDINDFNRDLLKEKGYSSAKEHHGDYNIMENSLNSVYSLFVYEIDVVEEKKQRLIGKIKDYKAKVLELLNIRMINEKNLVEQESDSNIQDIERQINNVQRNISLNTKEIDEIKNVRVKQEEDKISRIKEEILRLEEVFVKPPINWFSTTYKGIVTLILLVYLFLFYSSAGYILLYCVADSKEAKLSGVGSLSSNEVYNPDALSNAIEKGPGAILFIVLFAIIPIACALYSESVKNKEFNIKVSDVSSFFKYIKHYICVYVKKYGMIIALDTFIAYKVTKAIYEADRNAGLSGTEAPWEWTMAFTNIDFYLVFALGTFAVILFEIFWGKFKEIFESRNSNISKAKSKLNKEQKLDQINEINNAIHSLGIQKSQYEKDNVRLNSILDMHQKDLIYIPNKKESSLRDIENKYQEEIKAINNKTEVKINNIENDKFPISVDSLNDRISLFLEGWNEWLHDEFSVEKATSLSEHAIIAAKKWKENKIMSDIDKRIKSN